MGDAPRRVAVTGASGYVGTRLIRRLVQEPRIERILAIDVRPLPTSHGDKVVFIEQNVAAPVTEAFKSHGVEAVVHLAFILRPSRDRAAVTYANVVGTESVLVACALAGVGRIVYLSSTSVYGARPDNPEMLTEDDPPRPTKGFQYSEDKLAAESLITAFSRLKPDVTATILRACPIVGPNADNFIARAFLKPFLVGFRGHDPPMQLVHEDDVAEVLAHCTLRDAPGLYNVAGEGTIRWSEMARALGRRMVTLPAPLLNAAADLTWALRVQSDSPSRGLSFVRYAWTASTDKIKQELGVEFRHTARETWEAFARRHR